VVEQLTDYLLNLDAAEFDAIISNDELARRRMETLAWIDLVPAAKPDVAAVRLLRRLVMDNEFARAAQVFHRFAPSFGARASMCWEALFRAECAFQRWKQGEDAAAADAERELKAVLRFPGGWMRGQVGDEEIGKHCIPVVAAQLVEVVAAQQKDEPLGVAAMICDRGKLLEGYFDRDGLKRLLTDVLKPVVIKKLASGE
jgi:hypothetical protein